jgi:hypothetical protein
MLFVGLYLGLAGYKDFTAMRFRWTSPFVQTVRR